MAKKENEIINKTIDASGLDVPIEGVFMKEKRYLLTPLEYKILSESETKLKEWSKRFMFISIGLLLNIISKVIWFLCKFNNVDVIEKQNLKLNIEIWELISLCIGFVLAAIFYLLSHTKLDNSERKEIIKKIKKYFDEK